MRRLVSLLGALAMAVAALQATAQAQTGFDRRGGDYSNFPVRTGDPALCAARCEREARCRAWSFSYPRTANTVAICWLKAQVSPRVEDNCCVSGVRGAGVVEPRKGPLEFSIDRVGGDYRAEKIGAKIRDAQLALIPYMFVIGGREAQEGLVAVRDRLEGDLGAMPLAAAVEKLQAEIRAKTVRRAAK